MYSQTYGKQQASKTAKLKFFCQMCRKQCFDENGFRCHLNSAHHMKMMREYNENPDFYIEQFSSEFEEAFLELLKTKYASQKIGANKVYEEMIRQVDHVHLNGTKWTKLHDFLQYLIQDKKIGFDHSAGDILIWNSENKPEKIKYDKVETKKQKTIKNQNELIDKSLEKLILKNQQQLQQEQLQQDQQEQEQQQNQEEVQEGQGFISFDININTQKKVIADAQPLQQQKEEAERKHWFEPNYQKQQPNLEKLYNNLIQKNGNSEQNQEIQKQKDQDEFAWIKENIVVKITDKNLSNGKFYNKKGIIKKIVDQYGGLVEIQNNQVIVDQKYLQTVIPKIGNQVMVLKDGEYRGEIGKLESIHQDNFSGSVFLEKKNVLIEVPFDLFSKINCE